MSNYISELDIHRFRGIRALSLPNLGAINVLVGANNCGKTSILEAIGLLSNPLDRPNFQKWAIMRVPKDSALNEKMAEYIDYLFPEDQEISFYANVAGKAEHVVYKAEKGMLSNASGESSKALYVTGLFEVDNVTTSKEFQFRNNGRGRYKSSGEQFSTEYIFAGGNFYKNCVFHVSESMLLEKKLQLLEIIRSFEPDVEDIMLRNNDILLHSRQSGVLPLFNYGSGLQKAVLLAASLMNIQNNVILIDEIDSTINMAAFEDVFPWFIQKCRELNVQAFLTTHSLEAIDAILAATDNSLSDDVRIITLRKTPKTHMTVAKIRTGAEARSDRSRFEMELRI